jgi:hypothetical protein
MPIVDALSAKGKAIRVGDFTAYPGPIGIRGSTPEHLAEVQDMFFREVGPALPRLVPGPSLHALALMVLRNPDGAIDGEFRVDGEPSAELKRLAIKVNWPKGQSTYMLKQFYVLAPTGSNPAR